MNKNSPKTTREQPGIESIVIAGTHIVPIELSDSKPDRTIRYKDLVKHLRQCRQEDWLIGASLWSIQLLYQEIQSYDLETHPNNPDELQIPPQKLLFIPDRISHVALTNYTHGRSRMTSEKLRQLGSMVHELTEKETDIEPKKETVDDKQSSPTPIDALRSISGDIFLQSKLGPHRGGWLSPLARTWQIFYHRWQAFDDARNASEPWQQDLLGCDVEQFIQASSVVWNHLISKYAANSELVDRGYSYDARITLEELDETIKLLDMDSQLLDILRRHFIRTARYLRKVAKKHQNSQKKKWSLNPLNRYPIIDLEDGYLVVPVPSYLLNKVSPSGIYYMGYDKYGENFTSQFGYEFQNYVGKQLELLSDISGVRVLPEIRYGRKGNIRDTVDFFLLTEDITVLMEVKIYRPIQKTQEGTEEGYSHLQTRIQKAYNQIQRTYEDMQSGDIRELPITACSRIIGLIVTLDPFHLINDPGFDDLFTRPTIPTAIVSIDDLEGAIAKLLRVDNLNEQLLKLNTHVDNPFQTLKNYDITSTPKKNPIIDETLQHIFPF